MMYNYITQSSRKIIFNSITYILICAFTFTTVGCYTSFKGEVAPEKVTVESNYQIIKAIMKSGLVIDLRNKGAVFVNNYMGKKNVLVYSAIDTSWIKPDVYNVSAEKVIIIEAKDIKSLLVEKEVINESGTILAIVVVAAALALIIGIIALAANNKPSINYTPSGSSCPFVFSLDGDKYRLDAEPYPGAIAEGLKKTDYSKLEYLNVSDGKYKILLRNETDETQLTDEMKLLVIDHPINTEIATDIKGQMTQFEKVYSPLSVTDEKGKDILVFFKDRDDIEWQTDMPVDNSYEGKNLRHDLMIKFPKPHDAKNVKLLFKAGTAQWGEHMVKEMLDLKGNKIDDWYKDVNNKGDELTKFYKFMQSEELYMLRVNVFENDSWTARGMIPTGGPYVAEERIVELNIENVTGDTLCIKLNPAFGFWKFDYAGAIYDSEIITNVTEIPVSYAKDENGIDVKDLLSGTDGKYYSMPELKNYAKIEFEVPVQNKKMKRSLYLKTSGYYDIHLKRDKGDNSEMVEKIYNTPGLILEMSMKSYIEKIKSLGMLEN